MTVGSHFLGAWLHQSGFAIVHAAPRKWKKPRGAQNIFPKFAGLEVPIMIRGSTAGSNSMLKNEQQEPLEVVILCYLFVPFLFLHPDLEGRGLKATGERAIASGAGQGLFRSASRIESCFSWPDILGILTASCITSLTPMNRVLRLAVSAGGFGIHPLRFS